MRPALASPRLSIAAALALTAPVAAEEKTPFLPAVGWTQSDAVSAIHEIRGTGTRHNPLRRALEKPYADDVLHLRFRLSYAAAGIDNPPASDGEFFVLWLDEREGDEGTSHSNGAPNVGIHVKGTANHFMARFRAGAGAEQYARQLEGDREFLVVARLSKSQSGTKKPYDRLALWIDPREGEHDSPHAEAESDRARVSEIRWIGFGTGRKTEPGDRIRVRDLALARDWKSVLSDSPAPPPAAAEPKVVPLKLSEIPPAPAFEPPAPPEKLAAAPPVPREDIETDHWAFQPIADPDPPATSRPDWVRSPVDRFVAARHDSLGLSPAPPADPATLARRMALVLTGLPPAEDSELPATPEAFDRYAEKLLDSPAYGERWGRHWLDVARWAESNGHQHNRDRKHAWRYRDWVVDAFNRDLPYDQFLRAQIAGDEIEPYRSDNLVATGFLAAARYSGNELDKDIQRFDILADIVNTTSKSVLGLTMECAQCHDHFFDPLSQWDYFNLMAYFAQGQPGDVILDPDEETGKLVEKRWALFESVRDRMKEKKRAAGTPEPVLVSPENVPKGLSPEEKATLDQLDRAIAERPASWAFYSPVTSPHRLAVAPHEMRWPLPVQRESLEHVRVRFLDRGDIRSPGPVADPAWPRVFGPTPEDAGPAAERPRLALADWLASSDHPLTARVWVNRIWRGHFGRGLVATPDDFGAAGEEPTHPELLDWLARELINSGWSTAHIHRLILESNTFRQSSLFSAANADADPGNAALWRWQPRRLESEAIRDTVLAAAGELDLTTGGPSVPLSKTESSHRRSLYLQQKRNVLPHQQMLFDGSDGITACGKRRVSTTGLQPLWMLNSDFMNRMAGRVAARVQKETQASSPEAQATKLIHLAYHRPGEKEERKQLTKLIQEDGLETAASVVLNTNEFVYIP